MPPALKNIPFVDKHTVLDVCDAFDELSEVGPVIVCGDFKGTWTRFDLKFLHFIFPFLILY